MRKQGIFVFVITVMFLVGLTLGPCAMKFYDQGPVVQVVDLKKTQYAIFIRTSGELDLDTINDIATKAFQEYLEKEY